jgi:hypothetical protein
LLPDIEVDRENVEAKIQSRHYDAVVYGSVHRCRDYMQLVLDTYPANKIAFIDGEDGPELSPAVGHGWYFKREIYEPNPDLLPIQFGIPKEKIRPIDLSRKTRLMAPLIPGDYSTYLYYDSEERYYDQYSDSYFGLTRKKGGWDCMRHYEIMAAGTLPYFSDFESCPLLTLDRFPREEFYAYRRLHDDWDSFNGNMAHWLCMAQRVHAAMTFHLTTEAIAKRVLDRLI